MLLDRAVELAAAPQGLMPTWDIYHYRGRVRLKQGRLREALDDLRIALRLARAWRWSAPPDEASRIGNEGWLDQVYSAFIEAGNRLYFETGDAALIRETFEAAEENRASSLRALFKERQAQIADLPPSYWEATAGLQRAEIAALRSADTAAQLAVQAARAELAVMEASLVSPWQPRPGEGAATRRFRPRLGDPAAQLPTGRIGFVVVGPGPGRPGALPLAVPARRSKRRRKLRHAPSGRIGPRQHRREPASTERFSDLSNPGSSRNHAGCCRSTRRCSTFR